jgi:hypothetical protein
MESTGPRKATTYRPTSEDRAAIDLLRRELGQIPMSSLISMGLRELLKRYGLVLPAPAAKKKPAKASRAAAR